ncbi:MAG: mechanosensitive ion channel [bacterium]|nr:MAG: mechanosensitive ion channel [bacterium]
MNVVQEWIERTIGLSPGLQEKIIISFVAIGAIWIIRSIILRISLRRVDDPTTRYRWQKTSNYIAVVLALMLVGRIWIAGLQSLITFFGLLSAGLAIALRDPIMNFVGWIFILWRRPFSVGDRIQIGVHAGDVIDVRIFQFTLAEIRNWVDADQNTGRIIHVPNSKVFTEAQANFSKGFHYIWNEIPVLITFESDWKQAKQILQTIASEHAEELSGSAEQRVREAARRYLMIFTKLSPTVYTCVRDSGVLLTIRYLCEPRQRRETEQAIWEDVLDEFAKHDTIDFAYPTRRIYSRLLETGDVETDHIKTHMAGDGND